MTHREFEQQLDAFVDGELAPEDVRELEAHMRGCRDCFELHRARMALGAAIRERVRAFEAPPELRANIRTAIRASAERGRMIAAWRPLTLAAALAAVAVGSWQVTREHMRAQALTEQVVTSHVRSLMAGHLTDVVSSDQHTVKPWFNGKLDFSPPVSDFAGRGFPLIGGRLDYLGGRRVAALVYGRRQHLINVFVWPAALGPTAGPATATRQGYHMLHWRNADYVYWVASDLGFPELRDFVALVQHGDAATPAS